MLSVALKPKEGRGGGKTSPALIKKLGDGIMTIRTLILLWLLKHKKIQKRAAGAEPEQKQAVKQEEKEQENAADELP